MKSLFLILAFGFSPHSFAQSSTDTCQLGEGETSIKTIPLERRSGNCQSGSQLYPFEEETFVLQFSSPRGWSYRTCRRTHDTLPAGQECEQKILRIKWSHPNWRADLEVPPVPKSATEPAKRWR